MRREHIKYLLIFATLPLSGCGTVVPQIGEIWDDPTGTTTVVLEKKIKEKVFCELNYAVYLLNGNPDNLITETYPDPKNPSKTITLKRKPIPDTWGATLTLTLTVEEMPSLNPRVTGHKPLAPHNTVFPGGVVVPGPQSFAMGLGVSGSADATRYDKY